MEITKIKIRYLDGPRLKAVFSITFNNSLTINDCCIIIDEEKNMKFVAFPFTKDKNGEIVDLAHPINKDFKETINQKVFELYDNRQEEFVKNDVCEICKVTNCKIQKIEEGVFDVRLIFDYMFAINKLICKLQNNSLSFRHPYSKVVDEQRYYLVNFEKQILIQDITMWLAKCCMNHQE